MLSPNRARKEADRRLVPAETFTITSGDGAFRSLTVADRIGNVTSAGSTSTIARPIEPLADPMYGTTAMRLR